MCLRGSSSTHHELGSSFNAVLTCMVLLVQKVNTAVHSPAKLHVHPCLYASFSVGLSGHQNLKCVSILITFLLAMTEFQTRSSLMGRWIWGQFGVEPIRKGIGMPWWQEQLQLLKQEYKATTAGNIRKRRGDRKQAELQISRFTHKVSH